MDNYKSGDTFPRLIRHFPKDPGPRVLLAFECITLAYRIHPPFVSLGM